MEKAKKEKGDQAREKWTHRRHYKEWVLGRKYLQDNEKQYNTGSLWNHKEIKVVLEMKQFTHKGHIDDEKEEWRYQARPIERQTREGLLSDTDINGIVWRYKRNLPKTNN